MIDLPDFPGMTGLKLDRPFRFIRSLGLPEVDLPDRGETDLMAGPRQARLFLGAYDEDGIIDALERHGIMSALARQGISHPLVEFDASDPGRQHLRFLCTKVRPPVLIGETVVTETRIEIPLISKDEPRGFQALVVQWLLLQNPFASFTPERPALPGQRHPGLRIGRKVMELLVSLARRQRLDAIVNRPEFVHNAWLYSPHFFFVDPVAEGKLAALDRDLSHMGLAAMAWAVELGCVMDETGSRSIEFYHGEQILPNCRTLHDYFGSEAYQEAKREATLASHFRVDDAEFERRNPLRPDGSLDPERLPPRFRDATPQLI